MKQRSSYHYQLSDENIPIKPLQQSIQINQHSISINQPKSNKNSARNSNENRQQGLNYKNQDENQINIQSINSINTSQDVKPLIMRVKRYKKKLQSVLGNYQPIQISPKSELKKDIMFPRLFDDKLKKKIHKIGNNMSIKIEDNLSSPPQSNQNSPNQTMVQDQQSFLQSIDQKIQKGIKGGIRQQDKENNNFILQSIINDKNDMLDMQIKQQNQLNIDNLNVLKQKRQNQTNKQYCSIDNTNNQFIKRNARAISQIEHNRRGQNNRSYQVESVYMQSSQQKQNQNQLTRDSSSVDYTQNQTPHAKQVYSSLRNYYPQTQKSSKMSLDLEEFTNYKNSNQMTSTPHSSSFHLNTLQSSKQSFALPSANQFNQQNINVNNHLSARSSRKSKAFGNGCVAANDSVQSSIQTISNEENEGCENKLKQIQVSAFTNQAVQQKNQYGNSVQKANQNITMMDSLEIQKKRLKNQNKVSLNYKYLEDFSVFPEDVQQSATSRCKQNQSKNSVKKSGGGNSLSPSPNRINKENRSYRKQIRIKQPVYNHSKSIEQTIHQDENSLKSSNKCNIIKETPRKSPTASQRDSRINQSLEFQNQSLNTIYDNQKKDNKISLDDEIKKINQLQQKNYKDLQNYVNIHLDLINIKTQIRIKSSLAGKTIKNS